jgi:hypothetical protein
MTSQTVPLALPRDLLAKYFGKDPRLLFAFEQQAQVVQNHDESLTNNVAATTALADASVLTLSPNNSLNNEYVMGDGDGTNVNANAGKVQIDVDDSVARVSGGAVQFIPPTRVTLALPAQGTLLSDSVPPSFGGLVNAATDSAAASAGVPVNGVYHNSGALRVRLT